MGKTSQHLGERIKQHVPNHLIEPVVTGGKKRRGRPPKTKSDKPASERYQSAIACHLAANEDCRKSFDPRQFSILSRARSSAHLHILEAIFIHTLKPALCKQKSFVQSLQLFGVK